MGEGLGLLVLNLALVAAGGSGDVTPMQPDQNLPKPARRQHIHRRTYVGDMFEREDGLFDVDLEMRDTKPFSIDNQDRGYIAAGEALHHMKMRVTVNDQLEIVDVEARTLASPFHLCAAITPQYKYLVGLRITAGFLKKAQEITGRTAGCTHLNDMLKIIGSTAMQGFWSVMARRRRAQVAQNGQDKTADREAVLATAQAVIGTCHAYAPSSPIVAREWPELHVSKKSAEPSPEPQ